MNVNDLTIGQAKELASIFYNNQIIINGDETFKVRGYSIKFFDKESPYISFDAADERIKSVDNIEFRFYTPDGRHCTCAMNFGTSYNAGRNVLDIISINDIMVNLLTNEQYYGNSSRLVAAAKVAA